MNYMIIGEVSSTFQILTRMLRYYEKSGLIESTRKEGYAY
ncbi:MAG: MerR family DNA-binding transcriptional regulator [Lachnospiraceae bacterium]|nr:MerR family DNA-binding transcriptional regulator [Lachnospiraceae bacterium]